MSPGPKLGLCLVYVTWAEAQGQRAAQYVPTTMLITAAVFALACLPTFLLLKERAAPRAGATPARPWRVWRNFRDLRRFLLCSLFYQAGIQTVITLAAVYATQAMGLSTRQALLLVVNITGPSAPCCWAMCRTVSAMCAPSR